MARAHDDRAPQRSDGFFEPRGNQRHVFEKREAPLCFMQPYYNPIVQGPEKVPNEPHRITPALREFRGREVAEHGARRIKEIRRLPTEFKDRIKEVQDREKQEEAERNKSNARLRWWHTRQSVELRDLLKVMKFNNYTFKPELLLNAKDVVILNLTGCSLHDEAMTWVSTFLQQNGTLRRLTLQGNHITSEGVEFLREGLRKSSSITDLDISLNPIGDNGLNTLISAFSENRRNTKIAKLNISTCNLTPSSGYHVARLIRDFKTIEVIYAWRNRLGAPTNSELAGVGLIFDEMAVSKTLKHIDLSANCLSDSDVAKHATVMEQQARAARLDEIVKRNRKDKIDQLAGQIAEMKAQELWEDEKVILSGLERELVQERAKYKEQLEDDARTKRLKTKDFEWIERVRRLTGRELADPVVKIRLVLMSNHSVSPMTVSRLSQFYDLNSKDDTQDWIERVRRYDHMLKPRRGVGEAYEYRTTEEAEEAGVEAVFDYEADMRRLEEDAREERAKELDELRKQGVVASDVLEERLRGNRPRTGATRTSDSRSGTATSFNLTVGVDGGLGAGMVSGEEQQFISIGDSVTQPGDASSFLDTKTMRRGSRSATPRQHPISPRNGPRTPREGGGGRTPRGGAGGPRTPRDTSATVPFMLNSPRDDSAAPISPMSPRTPLDDTLSQNAKSPRFTEDVEEPPGARVARAHQAPEAQRDGVGHGPHAARPVPVALAVTRTRRRQRRTLRCGVAQRRARDRRGDVGPGHRTERRGAVRRCAREHHAPHGSPAAPRCPPRRPHDAGVKERLHEADRRPVNVARRQKQPIRVERLHPHGRRRGRRRLLRRQEPCQPAWRRDGRHRSLCGRRLQRERAGRGGRPEHQHPDAAAGPQVGPQHGQRDAAQARYADGGSAGAHGRQG
jgi:hypothetical protein